MNARRRRRLLFAFVPVIALVAAAELGARVLMSDENRGALFARYSNELSVDERVLHESFHQIRGSQFVPDPYAGYRFPDPADPASRQPPYLPAPEPSPDEARIVCAGDSVTYGRAWEVSWPGKLERVLNASPTGPRYTVYNAAVPGHSAIQAKRMVQSRWLELKPDVLIWYEQRDFADRLDLPEPYSETRMAALDALYRSRALYLLTLGRQWMKDRRKPVERVFDAAVDVGPAPIRPVLPAFVEWCGRRGVGTFVIVDYLEIANGEVRSIEGDIDGYSRAFPPTPSARVLFVDTLTPMREAQARGVRLFDDAIHLTPEGMDVVAEAVAKAIQGQ